jgi:hypothetical protein
MSFCWNWGNFLYLVVTWSAACPTSNGTSSAQPICLTVARGEGMGVRIARVLGLVPLQFEDVHGCVWMHSTMLLIGNAGCNMVFERERQQRRRKYAAQEGRQVGSSRMWGGR